MSEYRWVYLKDRRPSLDQEVIICDNYGQVFTDTYFEKVFNVARGELTWEESWEFGNGSKIVAWHPIPEAPTEMIERFNKEESG